MKKYAAIITGSTKGIGKAISYSLLQKGYFVYMNYGHDDITAEAVNNEFRTCGLTDFKIIKSDMSCDEGISSFLSEIDFENFDLRMVILNVSTNGTERHSFGNITRQEMNEVFNINLFTPFLLLQKLSPKICDNGRIIFISSAMGIYPHSTYIPYGLSKSAEIFLSKMLVKEFSERRITVNTIAPHCIQTDMFPGKRSAEHINSLRSKLAVHRFGTVEEIASAVMLIESNDYINGTTISIDGGYDYA